MEGSAPQDRFLHRSVLGLHAAAAFSFCTKVAKKKLKRRGEGASSGDFGVNSKKQGFEYRRDEQTLTNLFPEIY